MRPEHCATSKEHVATQAGNVCPDTVDKMNVLSWLLAKTVSPAWIKLKPSKMSGGVVVAGSVVVVGTVVVVGLVVVGLVVVVVVVGRGVVGTVVVGSVVVSASTVVAVPLAKLRTLVTVAGTVALPGRPSTVSSVQTSVLVASSRQWTRPAHVGCRLQADTQVPSGAGTRNKRLPASLAVANMPLASGS